MGACRTRREHCKPCVCNTYTYRKRLGLGVMAARGLAAAMKWAAAAQGAEAAGGAGWAARAERPDGTAPAAVLAA